MLKFCITESCFFTLLRRFETFENKMSNDIQQIKELLVSRQQQQPQPDRSRAASEAQSSRHQQQPSDERNRSNISSQREQVPLSLFSLLRNI